MNGAMEASPDGLSMQFMRQSVKISITQSLLTGGVTASTKFDDGGVAQRIEQRPSKPKVEGSSPSSPAS